jgi:hypothetical protein
LRIQFEQLKADFLHNEGVLRERDDELSALGQHLSYLSTEVNSLKQAASEAEAANISAQTLIQTERRRFALQPAVA